MLQVLRRYQIIKMSRYTQAALERQYGKPLMDQAEIERRFRNAVARIDVAKMARKVAQCERDGELCQRPPYEDKIGVYFGSDINTADKWERELCTHGFLGNVPYGWCNRERVLIRGDLAAYVLSGEDGEKNMAKILEEIVSGDWWYETS